MALVQQIDDNGINRFVENQQHDGVTPHIGHPRDVLDYLGQEYHGDGCQGAGGIEQEGVNPKMVGDEVASSIDEIGHRQHERDDQQEISVQLAFPQYVAMPVEEIAQAIQGKGGERGVDEGGQVDALIA